ncbi:MAG: hypothetical protein BGP06_20825 [Rhizobiales bacterium 65-9]|nr:zinc-ribbon domain-containing protein [Hyphomicrobiales bacterium]OJY36472.1 MAG: hypothetical protein BGP06_20825 [Rhizobiales bacterium 65-9]
MLLVCPSCASSYNIPIEKLGKGRTVRCKRCHSCWYASPPPEPDAFDAAIAPILAAADETAERELSRFGAEPQEAQALFAAPPTGGTLEAAEASASETRPMDEAVEPFATARDGADPAEIDGAVFAVSARPADPAPAAAPAPRVKITVIDRLLVPFEAARALLSRRPSSLAAEPELMSPVLQASALQRRAPGSDGSRGSVAIAAPYAAFGLSCLLVIGLAARGPIMTAAPATAKLYTALGLADQSAPVAIISVRSEIGAADGGDVLLVEGEVASRAREAVNVPAIRVVVRDAQGVELYAWPAQSLKPTLEPGERTVFRARLAAPPANGRTVQVRFEKDAA